MRAIVIYASCGGQTRRIAQRVAKTMTQRRVPTDTFDVTKLSVTELAVNFYDAVVFGSPIYFGEHDRRILWCMREHRRFLASVPTAFFSVCLNIINAQEERCRTNDDVTNDMRTRIPFQPSRHVTFAGALRYSEYGWLKKRIMHSLALQSGYESELGHDREYTDWDHVNSFAVDFADEARAFHHQSRSVQIPADAKRPAEAKWHRIHRSEVQSNSPVSR
ncbi:flavodoxin domain-containing protein [Rhodopirellula sallentina]|uniref:Protoporphyrinogen oxidase n=1 Tax=Rhodopirellula sallentina SM41 TaxID=1263870 RepID=M5UL33_9BACT|nr:flavodoxin domain-containing protein [Rhodopirellula sallentina]EMI56703.1 protoporphyrinogen oxidase [Rhodopirellula sallentina SM41]